MVFKFNTLKSIKQALIGPNILFPAAYLLFSAEVCTRTAKNKSSSHTANPSLLSLTAKPVDQEEAAEKTVEEVVAEKSAEEQLAVQLAEKSAEAVAVSKASEAAKSAEEAAKLAVEATAAEVEAVSKASEAAKLAVEAAAEVEAVAKVSEASRAVKSAEEAAKNLPVSEASEAEKVAQASQAAVEANKIKKEEEQEKKLEKKRKKAAEAAARKKAAAEEEKRKEAEAEEEKRKEAEAAASKKVANSQKSRGLMGWFTGLGKSSDKPKAKHQNGSSESIANDCQLESGINGNQANELADGHRENSKKKKNQYVESVVSEGEITQKFEKNVVLYDSVDVGPSVDNILVDQVKQNNPIKDAEANKNLNQQLDEAFNCLMSFANPTVSTDSRSFDQPMEHDIIKDDQERNRIQEMQDMVSSCENYLTEN